MSGEKIEPLYEGREKLMKAASDPMNKMTGISEATGLKILDGIYVLILLLHELIPQSNNINRSKP